MMSIFKKKQQTPPISNYRPIPESEIDEVLRLIDQYNLYHTATSNRALWIKLSNIFPGLDFGLNWKISLDPLKPYIFTEKEK